MDVGSEPREGGGGGVWGPRLTIQRWPEGPSQGPSPKEKALRVMSLPPNTLKLLHLTESKSLDLSMVYKALCDLPHHSLL